MSFNFVMRISLQSLSESAIALKSNSAFESEIHLKTCATDGSEESLIPFHDNK